MDVGIAELWPFWRQLEKGLSAGQDFLESCLNKAACFFFSLVLAFVFILDGIEFVSVKPDACAARAGINFNLFPDAVVVLLHDCCISWASSFCFCDVCFGFLGRRFE